MGKKLEFSYSQIAMKRGKTYFPISLYKKEISEEAKMYIVRLVNCLEMSFVKQQQKNGRGGVRAIVVEENSSKKDQNSPCGKMSIKVFFIKGPGSRRIGLHTLCY